MSDIIERLRETASCADYVVDREIAAEAADTITRLTAENKKLRAALYDCLETTAKHHAEDQARAQIGGSDMALRKAKAILTRSSLLFGKIRTIVNAALEGKQ